MIPKYKLYENNPLELLRHIRDQEDESTFRSLMGIAPDGSFKAICLSGWRTENNSGEGIDFFDGKKLVIL